MFATYVDGTWKQDSIRAGWSTTKSLCAELYGVAVQQGFAGIREKIANKNANTRQCNVAADYENVLTMTGESSDISNPSYSYDTLGTNCLDTLQDFISANNPEGLTTRQWKDKHWQGPLGMEHTQWGNIFSGNLGCGFGAETSCRDLARAAQLWVNKGQWPGAGQMMNKQYSETGITNVFPSSGRDYGYTVGLNGADPVDTKVASMNGMFAQCATFSQEHNAVVVSMGQGSSCGPEWRNTRHALVSNDHALYNTTATKPVWETGLRPGDKKFQKSMDKAFKQEVLALEEFVAPSTTINSDAMSKADLKSYTHWLAKFKSGGEA